MLAGRFSSDSSVDCRVDPLGPLSPDWTARDLPYDDALPHDEFYVVIDRDHAVPRNCTQLASVTRHRHWREVSMTYVAHCRLAPPLLDHAVAFVRLPAENMAPPQWAYVPEGWVMRDSAIAIDSAGDSASLTFQVSAYCDQGGCSLVTNTYVYGPVTMLVLHAWSVLWVYVDDVATTSHAYHVRHLGVVVIGLVGVAAVAATGRVVLRSWRWGLVAAAVLAAVPMWTGHAMFNVKDVPVATGHTLCTLALLLFVRDVPPRWPLRVGRAGFLVAGLVLTLGTRPGMWSGLTVLLAVAVVGVSGSPSRRAAVVTLAELLGACAVAAAALVASYPNLFGHPLRAAVPHQRGVLQLPRR